MIGQSARWLALVALVFFAAALKASAAEPYIIADVFSLTNTSQAITGDLNLGNLNRQAGLYLIPYMIRLQYLRDNLTAWGIQVYTNNSAYPHYTFTASDGIYGGLRGRTDPMDRIPLYWQIYGSPQSNTTTAGGLGFYSDTLRFWGRVRDRADEDVVSSWDTSTTNLLNRTVVGYKGLGDYPTVSRRPTDPMVYFYLGMDVSGVKATQTFGTTLHVDLYNLNEDIGHGGYATPNPFTPMRGQKTNFNFFLRSTNSAFVIRIYTIRGRLIRTLTTESEWDGRNDVGQWVEGGLYVYQIEADHKRVSGTVVLIK